MQIKHLPLPWSTHHLRDDHITKSHRIPFLNVKSFQFHNKVDINSQIKLGRVSLPIFFQCKSHEKNNLIQSKMGVEESITDSPFLKRISHSPGCHWPKLSTHIFKSGYVLLLQPLDVSHKEALTSISAGNVFQDEVVIKENYLDIFTD